MFINRWRFQSIHSRPSVINSDRVLHKYDSIFIQILSFIGSRDENLQDLIIALHNVNVERFQGN